jgi:hypothetical protein
MGSGLTGPPFLTLVFNSSEQSASHTCPYIPTEQPTVFIVQEAKCVLASLWMLRRKQKSFGPVRIETLIPSSSARRLVTVLTGSQFHLSTILYSSIKHVTHHKILLLIIFFI